jgi:putative protein-disulfide isomerase
MQIVTFAFPEDINMTTPFPRVIYVYDAHCGWCFGFKSNILKLKEKHGQLLEFEVLSGNMVPIENRHHIGKMAAYIAEAYHRVEEMTGCKFGEGYLNHILHPESSELMLSSEKPGIALTVYKQISPERSFEFASALQDKIMIEGKDLENDEVYRELAVQFGIDADNFVAAISNEDARDMAHAEFAMVKQLGITGFPCVLVQTDERKLFMIARGYAAFDDLCARLDKVLEDFRIANN